MKETARERYIITGHDQLRRNKVVHFRRKLEEGQNTLEDVAAADAEKQAALEASATSTGVAPAGRMADDPANEQALIGPRDERIETARDAIIPDGTVIVFIKGWEVETARPVAAKKTVKP